jgi:PilZ domain
VLVKVFDALPMRDLAASFSSVRLESAMSQETVARNDGDVRERRRHERFAVDGDAEVMVNDGTLLFRGRTVDISLSGCFIETRARLALEQGTPAQMVFRAGHLTLRMSATVRSVRPGSGAGFLFGAMSAYMQAGLEGLIAEMQGRVRPSIR